MIPLDRYEKWAPILDEYARQYLDKIEYQEYQSISDFDKLSQLKAILEKPIAHFTLVNEVYFRARWAEALSLTYPGKDLVLLEVASGDADMIPQMMARTRPHSRYISANMNRELTARLRRKTRDLPVEIVVLEEDAIKANYENMIASAIGWGAPVRFVKEGIPWFRGDWRRLTPWQRVRRRVSLLGGSYVHPDGSIELDVDEKAGVNPGDSDEVEDRKNRRLPPPPRH